MNTTPQHPTIYIDIDGTLLGKNASLFHDHQGKRTSATVNALTRAENQKADLVITTGRDSYRTSEFCRSIGISKYIAEMGCVLHTTGNDIVTRGDYANSISHINDLSTEEFLELIHQAALMLINSFPDHLELHSPYNRDSYVSYKLRGNVSINECNDLLKINGWDFLELIPNGYGMFRRSMPNVNHVLIYHLMPKGVTKAFGIEQDQRLRGLVPSNCYMIGDGISDAQCHGVVNQVFIPSNGPLSDPNITEYAHNKTSITILEESHNLGFAKAIDLIFSQYNS